MKKLTIPKILFLVLLGALLTLLAMNFMSDKEKQVRKHIEHRYGIADPQFVRSMGVLLGPAMVDGNRVETLLNGDQIFPAMLGAIRAARKTITFETYIYWSGKVGKDFADALVERARAGVKVHILLDWVGTQKMDDELLKTMEQSGIEIQRYHPLTWYSLDRINNRTHRKLLIADGQVAFTGGVGIADNWSGNAQDKDHWRDTHYRVEGPAVAHMQAAFNDNWLKVSGVVLHGDSYFPPIEPAGKLLAQMFKSSPDGGSDSMHLMYLLSLAAATQTIDLAMAYFVPDDLALEALEAALKRGVRVRIIMPGKLTDSKTVRGASRALWGGILKAGAELYEYQPTMYHCKVLIVDDVWVSVGSTNFDDRSFRLNDEANLNVYDAVFAVEQSKVFEEDKAKSRLMTRAEFKNRALFGKILDKIAGLFRGQL